MKPFNLASFTNQIHNADGIKLDNIVFNTLRNITQLSLNTIEPIEGVENFLNAITAKLTQFQNNPNNYSSGEIESFHKNVRFLVLVLSDISRDSFTNAKEKNILLELTSKVGKVPVLNAPSAIHVIEPTQSKDLNKGWKNPNRNSKNEKLTFYKQGKTAAVRTFLLDEKFERPGLPFSESSAFSTEAAQQVIQKNKKSAKKLFHNSATSIQPSAPQTYYMSYYDAEYTTSPSDLHADHLQPSEQIIKRQQELIEAMNLDPEFAARQKSLNANYFTNSGNEIVGTKRFFMAYHNNTNNLWLIRGGANIGKTNVDPIVFLKTHPRYGKAFLEYIGGEAAISKEGIFYTIQSNNPKLNDRLLADVAKEWFQLYYPETIHSQKILSQQKDSFKNISVSVESLPKDQANRHARNNTIVEIKSILLVINNALKNLESNAARRKRGEVASRTLNTGNVGSESVGLKMMTSNSEPPIIGNSAYKETATAFNSKLNANNNLHFSVDSELESINFEMTDSMIDSEEQDEISQLKELKNCLQAELQEQQSLLENNDSIEISEIASASIGNTSQEMNVDDTHTKTNNVPKKEIHLNLIQKKINQADDMDAKINNAFREVIKNIATTNPEKIQLNELQNFLNTLEQKLNEFAVNPNDYSQGDVEHFHKNIRLLVLVLGHKSRAHLTNLAQKELLQQFTQHTGEIPMLNSDDAINSPVPDTKANRIGWKNPGRESKDEKISFYQQGKTAAVRTLLLNQQVNNNHAAPSLVTTNKTAGMFGQPAQPESAPKPMYYMSYYDAEYMKSPSDLHADHLQPSDQIIRRQNELVDAMNIDPRFASEQKASHPSYFTGRNPIMGTKKFFMDYHNNLNNLWLIRGGANVGKNNADSIAFLKAHPRYGELFFQAIGGEQAISKKGIFYTIQSPDPKLNNRLLADVAKEWFQSHYSYTIESQKTLSQQQDDFKITTIAIESLPKNNENRHTRNNTIAETKSIILVIENGIKNLHNNLQRRLRGDITSRTANTADPARESIGLNMMQTCIKPHPISEAETNDAIIKLTGLKRSFENNLQEQEQAHESKIPKITSINNNANNFRLGN